MEGGSIAHAERSLPSLYPSLARLPTLSAKATRKNGMRTTPAPTRPTKRFSSKYGCSPSGQGRATYSRNR